MKGNKNAVKDKDVPSATPPPPTIGDILDDRNSGVVNTTVSERGSTNADYLTSRIARDRPDILERMKAMAFTDRYRRSLCKILFHKIPRLPARRALLLGACVDMLVVRVDKCIVAYCCDVVLTRQASLVMPGA